MSFISGLLSFKWVILFYTLLTFIIYLNRKKFEQQAPFVYLYKTKIGLKLMEKWGKRHRKLVHILGYIGIAVGYIGFFIVTFVLLKNAFDLAIDKPGAVGGSPVIPGLPIAGLGITFPLVIGWISLFIIIIVHEFAHGLLARAHNVKVKSSGIAFFGPILGAFVEPDEQSLVKQKHSVQHSIFAAGPFSNVLLWLVCLALLFGTSHLLMNIATPGGIQVNLIQNVSLPAYSSGLENGDVITSINNNPISNFTTFLSALDVVKPQDEVIISTLQGETFTMQAVANPQNASKGFIGVTGFEQKFISKNNTAFENLIINVLLWFSELFQWTGFISINIGLINLFPIFITDGARMLQLNFRYLIKNRKKADYWWKQVNVACLFVMLLIVFLPLLRTIYTALLSLII